MLLSLAVIALLAAVLVGGASQMLSERPVTPEQVFWNAVQEARKAALKAEHEMRLRYDGEKKQFVLVDGLAPRALAADGFTLEEVPLKTFPIDPALTQDLTIDFLAAVKGGNMILVGGVLIESQPVPSVTFYSDGTCSAFRLQIVRAGGSQIVEIDPWTCAPVLPPATATAAMNR